MKQSPGYLMRTQIFSFLPGFEDISLFRSHAVSQAHEQTLDMWLVFA